MKIFVETRSVITGELQECLEWTNSKIDFSKYHYETIIRHLLENLYYSPYIVSYVTKNDKRILTFTAKIWCGKVIITVLNNSTGKIHYRKFNLNKWILPQYKIDSYKEV